MRKEKSLYCWYCSFSLSPSRSVEFVFQTRQLLFSLFPRLCWTLIFRARLRIMHIAFIHWILPCKDWFFFRHQCFMKQPNQTCSLIINTPSQKKKKRIKKKSSCFVLPEDQDCSPLSGGGLMYRDEARILQLPRRKTGRSRHRAAKGTTTHTEKCR